MKNYEVLLIMNSETLTQRIKLSLEEGVSQFNVTSAKSTFEGLDFLSNHATDAIILDLDADGNGSDNFTKFYDQYPDTPILVIADESNDEQAIQSLRQGAADFLIKGQLSPHGLRKTVLF